VVEKSLFTTHRTDHRYVFSEPILRRHHRSPLPLPVVQGGATIHRELAGLNQSTEALASGKMKSNEVEKLARALDEISRWTWKAALPQCMRAWG